MYAILIELYDLFMNIEFYVALGTILLAIATSWSTLARNRESRIADIERRINSLYLPLISIFNKESELDERDRKVSWEKTRMQILLAKTKTFNYAFDENIIHSSFKSIFLNENEFKKWIRFSDMLWNDFEELWNKTGRLKKENRGNGLKKPGWIFEYSPPR
ncbi:MAG: hypothetical protein ACYCPR_02580 [Thermoplasmataceae archaeon]